MVVSRAKSVTYVGFVEDEPGTQRNRAFRHSIHCAAQESVFHALVVKYAEIVARDSNRALYQLYLGQSLGLSNIILCRNKYK